MERRPCQLLRKHPKAVKQWRWCPNISTQFLADNGGDGDEVRRRSAETLELRCDPLAAEESASTFYEVYSVSDFPSIMHGSYHGQKLPPIEARMNFTSTSTFT
jgi:hypothetical protein